MLMGFGYVHLQPRTTTKPSILPRFWSIWFGACKSAPRQLLYHLSSTEGLSMLHISRPYFSSSSLKMQKLIIGKSYVLTLTRMRKGWKNFLQVIDHSHQVCCKPCLFCKPLYAHYYISDKWLGWNSDYLQCFIDPWRKHCGILSDERRTEVHW